MDHYPHTSQKAVAQHEFRGGTRALISLRLDTQTLQEFEVERIGEKFTN